MGNTREMGFESEDLAADFLRSNGYEILSRNWYYLHHEIDIVARKSGIIAIIEVRSLTSYNFQEPYQSVNRNKQRMIISAANAYVRKFNINEDVRFDIISIIKGKDSPKIEHIENAFYPLVK